MEQFKFLFFAFTAVFLLESCLGTPPPDDSKMYQEISNAYNNDPRSQELEYDFSNNETFESFVRKFSFDSLFQINRIEFPLKTIQHNKDLEELLSWTKEQDWRRVVFEETEDYSMTFFTNRKGEEGYVQFKGIENGIAVTYIFKLKDGEWYLVEMVDLST